jgi:hypothetical protein
MCKRKLLKHQRQAHDVINKLKFDVILHSNLGYMNLLRLRTSPYYLNQLRKDVFIMI